MKYYVILLILLFVTCGSLVAQIQNYYTFSTAMDFYTAITGTAVPTILGDNVLSAPIDIGFSFPYGTSYYTQVKMSSNGFLALGSTATSSGQTNSLIGTTLCPVVAPLWDNLSLTGGGAAYLTEGNAPNRIFTAQWSNCRWNNNSNSTFNFQAKLYETGIIELIYGSSTGNPTQASASIGINMSPGAAGNFYSVTPGANASASSTTEMATITAFPGNGTVYNFEPPAPMPDNLACLNVTGNLTPTVGNLSRYRVTVRNAGINPQTSYTVKLMNGTAELASVPGPALQPSTSATVTIPWTPAATGSVTMTGWVVLTGDTDPNNDQSSGQNIIVQDIGSNLITIGEGSQLARLPVDMFSRNSLYETIYQSSELDTACVISGVTFYNNFVTNLTAKPTKIWLGMTTQADLSAGWIPSTQLIQVFDGTVDYPSGQNTIHIDFTIPFAYTGNNLVMLVNRPMDTTANNTNDRFLCQTVGSARSRNIVSTTVTFDPANPPATGSTLSGQFPRTSFSYMSGGSDPLFGVSPAQKDWGTVPVNSINTQTFTVFNAGGTPLIINSVNLTGSPMYSLSGLPTFPLTLTTGQTSTFSCTYQPTAGGVTTATLMITDNLTGARTQHPVALTGDCLDTSVNTLPYTQNFDGVTVPDLPADWTFYVAPTSNASVTTVNSTIVTPHSEANSADLFNNGDNTGSVLLIAPPLGNALNISDVQIRFWARGYVANYVMSVGVMTDPLDATTYTELQSLTMPATWTEYTITLQTYIGTGRFIAFKHGLGGLYRGMYVDDFVIEAAPQNDLAAINLTGNSLPNLNFVSDYTVAVQNCGTVTQSNYAVQLFDQNNVEIAFAVGPQIAGGTTAQVVLPWIPTSTEVTGMYAKVTLNGDQNAANDQTSVLGITVQPGGSTTITVGTGDQSARIPLDFFRRNSLYETIYLQSELNFTGSINGITLHNNFADNCADKPTKIWIGTTPQSDLSTGWIASTQLTLVYDGNLSYPSGQHGINVIFTTPFQYDNNANLVMLFNRPMDTVSYATTNYFYCQTVGTNRARNVSSNTVTYDPAAPPATGSTLSGQFPMTDFIVTIANLGSLQGNVYGINDLPLLNANILLENGAFANTDAAGAYLIHDIIPGTYQVTVSHAGYVDTVQSITIPASSTITQNFTLVPLPTVTVTGIITGNDAPTVGLPGAFITLLGIDEYSATTDAAGQFTITGVTPNQTYNYTANHTGYQSATGLAVVVGSNLDLGTIILTEIAYAPVNVSAAEATNHLSISLNWLGPDFPDAMLSGGSKHRACPPSGADRSLLGYQVWRLAEGQETDEASWTLLTPAAINQLNYTDAGWAALTPGNYVWAVKGVYTGNVYSSPAFSNPLTFVTANDDQVITSTALLGNHPNPFNRATTITFAIKSSTSVKVEIFNIKGQLVRILLNESKSSGNHQITWDGSDPSGHRVAAGVYYYRLSAGSYKSTRPLLLK